MSEGRRESMSENFANELTEKGVIKRPHTNNFPWKTQDDLTIVEGQTLHGKM